MTALWEQRFRAPAVSFPTWARDAPDRLVFTSNESGTWQVYAWDRALGTSRRVTDDPIGVSAGVPTPDGKGVVWFNDVTGDEVGHWVYEEFDDDNGRGRRLVDGIPDGWDMGLELGEGIVVVGTSSRDGFRVWVADDGEAARVVHTGTDLLFVAGLSRDARLLCLQHSEHGDTVHQALRVIDSHSGAVVGDLWDGPGLGLSARGWSPVAGDQRLAIVHEREGRERPAIWELTTGERMDLKVDLPGDVGVGGWWPDGGALLLLHDHDGRHQLLRFDLGADEVAEIDHAPGTISGAGVRPDGEVWLRHANGASPPTIVAEDGTDVGPPIAEPPPRGQPFRSRSFVNPAGQRVHGFVCAPPAGGPHPVIMLVHGGPTDAWTDTYSPEVQAWVDHGVAVAMVNYRGSTGYGVEFRDALIGNPGFPEVEDVVAGLDSLARDGTIDPARAVIGGGSWGGYITLLGLGLCPDRWAAAVATVPIADYVSAYGEESPALQSFDRSLFGGTPDEVGKLYVERSPLTYVDRVQAPVLILAGDHDSRCPIQQVLNYVEALRARGGEVEVYRFDAGHGSMVVDERVRQMRVQLDFVLPRVGLPPQG